MATGFIKTIGNSFTAPTPSSASLTLSSGVTAKQGSILVTISFGNTASISVSSVTDSQGNTYVADHQTAANANNEVIAIYRCQDPKAMTSGVDTISVTLSGTVDHGINMIADLYSRLGAPNVTADFFTTPGSTTSAVSATPQASDVVAVSAVSFNAGVTTLVVASPFTIAGSQFQSTSVSLSCITAFDNSPGTSSITATYTETTTGHTSVATIVTYPAAPLATDTGTGADAASVTKILVSGADTGHGVDTATVAVLVTGTDTGTGADSAAVNTGAQPSASDTGHGVDSAAVNTGAQPSGADTGHGVDTASVFVIPPGPIVEPAWLAARAGMPGDSTAVNKSQQIGQFLAAHGITPVYQGAQIVSPQGSPSLAWLNLSQVDIDQPFTMPGGKTTIGRVVIPITPTGVGADVMVGLYTNSGGSPGTLITQTRIPASWLAQLGTPLATGDSPPLATAANNMMMAGPVTSTPWTQAAATLNGASVESAVLSSGDYTIVAGGFDPVTNSSVTNVASIAYLGGTSLANPVTQPSLPQPSWGGMMAAGTDTLIYAGGYDSAIPGVVASVYTASWDPSTGTIGAWTQQAALPQALIQGGMAAWNDFVYLASGTTVVNTPASGISTVYYANAANSQIQSWSTGPPLPQPLTSAYVAVIGNWLVVAGGANTSGTPVATVYYSAIRPDGSLVGWQNGPSLPEANYNVTQGWNVAVLGNALVLLSGTKAAGLVNDMPVLVFSADGPAPAWFRHLPPIAENYQAGYYPSSFGTWQVFQLTTPYQTWTFSPVPYISVPLPATGLTPGSTYHIVLHQEGGDLNDYVQAVFLQNALPATAQEAAPGSGGPWSSVGSSYSVPLGVWDQTPGGRILHTVEDSGARITSLIYTAVSGQLLGLCEATQFADGTWLAAVSEVDYQGMVPVGVTQLA